MNTPRSGRLPVLVILVILLPFAVLCKRTAGTGTDLEALDLLLRDDDIIDLKQSGETRYANDFNSLYDVINGGAQMYIDNGFEEGVYQSYVFGTSSFEMEVYDQGSATGAKGIYQDQYPASAEVFFSGDGREAVIDQSQMTGYSLQQYQNRFFIRINTAEKTDAALNIAKLISSNIVGKLESTE